MTLNFQSQGGLDAGSAALSKLSAIVHQQAALLSFMDVFYLLTMLFLSLAAFVMVTKRPPTAAGGGGGSGH